jgi:putative ABC transport system substrate-binding protein
VIPLTDRTAEPCYFVFGTLEEREWHMPLNIARRKLLAALGGAVAAWPLAARAQQPTMPVIGFLRSTPAARFTHLVEALRQGLKEEGFVEGHNFAIEQRWADNRLDQLPALAADLVSRQVAVIVCNTLVVPAAKAATTTIPIVFVSGDDPVKAGLVSSLNRPDGNLTGVTFFGGSQLGAKRIELLRDLVPKVTVIAVLSDSNYPAIEADLPDIEAAGHALGRRVVLVKVAKEADLEAAFADIVQAGAGAVLVSGGPFFGSQRKMLATLALRHHLPSIFDLRESVVDGGLMSYAASITGAYRQTGIYVGKIFKGAKPADLPVLQPTTFELAVNLKTAKALDIDIPQSIMLRADEVIE